jgi:hypothetical protein
VAETQDSRLTTKLDDLHLSGMCGRVIRPKGNRNAFKHGRYTIGAIASRREIAALLRHESLCEGDRV